MDYSDQSESLKKLQTNRTAGDGSYVLTNDRGDWRRGGESNSRIKVLQTSPLPLGYRAKKMERETGFEPATSTLARSHSTTELFPLKKPIIYCIKKL